MNHGQPGLTMEYEFRPLGSDLPATLRHIAERAQSLTRGTGAVIALGSGGSFLCRASVGGSAPALGARLDISSGFSGECVRTGRALRCDDTEADPRVEVATCRRLGIRSLVAAPIQYERDIVGLLEVLSSRPYAFEESDVTLVERLAQTVLLTVSQMDAL
jgi:GAF domain-containing protein